MLWLRGIEATAETGELYLGSMPDKENAGVQNSPKDPRVYLAAERIVLAWIRTGVALMAFGFVLVRCGDDE